MGSYVQLGEVRTYYDQDGDGPPLVLLHPGGADSRVFEVVVPGLAGHFQVFRPDRRGHGRTPDVDGPITYEQMARARSPSSSRLSAARRTWSATATGRRWRC
jgi:pimeloyl-ACP methyl ester carboxylesterase